MALDLTVHSLRLEYRALDAITFPSPLPGNALRGALGFVADPAIFAPHAATGPSGLRDRPRPYAFRARHLAGLALAPYTTFDFELHYFGPDPSILLDAFSRLDTLLGARVELLTHHRDTRILSLTPVANSPSRVAIDFLTPTELKRGFDFAGLLATIRDRISNLRSFHGDGPLPLDHRAFADRARAIRTVDSQLAPLAATRRSSRTGQTHPIGGLLGTIVYEGDFREFLPFLDAAAFTGAGRQASWGKGEILWRAID